MSKFKSYAEQGSFGGNYIKMPDQVSKFREQTTRNLAKMDRAQSFLEKNREGYLAAQKDAQRIEADQREANEQRRSAAQQQYIDILKRDADIEAQNTQAEIQQQEQLLRDLGQFSVTALGAFNEINRAKQERRIEQANAIVLEAGLTHSDAVAFANIDKTFTDQEAFASDEGQRILNEYGDTPAIRQFLAGTRNGRASYIYLQNKNAILNEVDNVLPGYLQEALTQMDPNLEPSQKLAAIDVAVGNFVKQFNVDPRILEGIAGDRIRAIKNQYKNTQIQANAQQEQELFTQQQIQVLNSMFDKDNVGAVVKYITTNPSSQKNQLFADWAISRLNTNTMSVGTYHDLFFKPQYMRDGKMVSFADQFKGTKWFVDVHNSLMEARNNANEAYSQLRQDRIAQANAQVVDFVNNEALADRRITREEENKMKDMLPYGIQLEELPVYDDLKYITEDARAAIEFERILEERYDDGILDQEWIDSQQLPTAMREKAESMLRDQEKLFEDKNYDMNLGRVKDLKYEGVNGISQKKQNTRGFLNSNTVLYEAMLVNKFKKQVKIFEGDSNKAASYVEQWHKTQGGGKEGGWTMDGGYEVVRQEQISNTNAGIRARRRHDNFARGIKNFYSTGNVNDLKNSMSEDMISEFQDDFNAQNKGVPSYIKVIAQEQGKDSFEMMTRLGNALGLGEYKLGRTTYADIKKGLEPLDVDFKLNNTYRYVPERNLRAFNVPSSGRGKFSGQVYGKQLTQLQMMQVAARAGFTPEQARIMSAIGVEESGGIAARDTVESGLDPEKKNEYSIGIFQINVLVHKDKLDRHNFTEDDMRDPLKNAIIAKEVYDERVAAGRDGFEPWTVYQKGLHLPHLENFKF